MIDHTHDPSLQSWVASANGHPDFPIQNLPFGVFGPLAGAPRGGIAAHAERMGPAYARMGAERGQHDPWTPDLVAQVEAERRAVLPAEEWDARVAWRDRAMMAALARRRGRDPA